MNEAYQTIRNNFIQNEELKRLEELKNKYANFQQPNYSTMSTHDELQTRFDLDELNSLQQKYGTQDMKTTQQINSQSSSWDNTLRKAEQLATGALDGLSLGWTDELEGAASAVGYGLASLNPNWNKTGESPWDAMKRGYVQGRDNRRQVLEQGLQENPVATTAAQMAGAFASPVKFFGYSQTAPLTIQNNLNKYNAIANGVAYGIGSGQDNWQNYAKSTASGIIGNLGGYSLSQQAFGRAASPTIRNAFNTMSGKATEYGVDELEKWYNY